MPISASSAAIARSHMLISVAPPPKAKPLTAATKIAGCSRIASSTSIQSDRGSGGVPASASARGLLEVDSGAKAVTAPGQHDRLAAGTRRVKGGQQFAPGLPVHGVLLLRPVEPDDGIAIARLDR